MTFRNVFVTVGTTEFNKLITTVLCNDVIEVLKEKGCQFLRIQFGAGKIPDYLEEIDIHIESYRYKDSISQDISEADLVISHAGAGTSIDVLEKGKPLITVINDDLMNNHQIELAEKLDKDGYSICCTTDTLVDAITRAEQQIFKQFTYKYDRKCALYIEKLLYSTKAS